MLLLEHDAKSLFAQAGIPITAGLWIDDPARIDTGTLPPGPWVVKAQVPVGGRGKAGAIRFTDTPVGIAREAAALIGTRVRGHRVTGCRIESVVDAAHEAYVALLVDPVGDGVRVLMSGTGGVDIEAAPDAVASVLAPATRDAVTAAAKDLAATMPTSTSSALADAASRLAELFFRYEAALAEINPLFITPTGHWCAGDAKLMIDENAIPRQDAIAALAAARPLAYAPSLFKLREGFDYVELDPTGTIGLVTTGAGLSMQLVDELVAAGERPFNFVDIRSGQFRGDPSRLIRVLTEMAQASAIRVVLVNIFAGITHLGEFATLLVRALEAVPGLRVPIVARLEGRGMAEARAILTAAPMRIEFETELDRAVARVVAIAAAGGAR